MRQSGHRKCWQGREESSRAAQYSTSGNRLRRLQKLSIDRKSTRLNSSHDQISYAVFCLKKKNIPARARKTPPPSIKSVSLNASFLAVLLGKFTLPQLYFRTAAHLRRGRSSPLRSTYGQY